MDKNIFLDKVVFGWIKKDLERMIKEIKVIPGNNGNINFPLTLCALVDIEYLGGFLLGSDQKFNKNANEYISKCFKKPGDYPVAILEDIFRNGLAHEYFARGNICREDNRPAIFRDPEIGVVLDANTLVNDFLASLEEFKHKLSEEEYEKKYKMRIVEAREKIGKTLKKHEESIKKLPERTMPSSPYSTLDMSGYSGPNIL